MKNHLILAISILLGTVAAGEVTGYPMYLPSFPYKNIYSLTCSDDILYISGRISYIGVHTGSAVVFDRTTKTLLPFPFVEGSIYDSASDGENGWFIYGSFTQIGCSARPGLAHIFADGTLDAGWSPPFNSDHYCG